jgi:hypothetical protein
MAMTLARKVATALAIEATVWLAGRIVRDVPLHVTREA